MIVDSVGSVAGWCMNFVDGEWMTCYGCMPRRSWKGCSR